MTGPQGRAASHLGNSTKVDGFLPLAFLHQRIREHIAGRQQASKFCSHVSRRMIPVSALDGDLWEGGYDLLALDMAGGSWFIFESSLGQG